MALQQYDEEPGSWGRQSDGWPEIRDRANDKYIFLNKLTDAPVPHGGYVLMDSTTSPYLRVHSQYVEALEAAFKAAGEPTADQMMARYRLAVDAQTQDMKKNPARYRNRTVEWPTVDQWW